MIVLALSQTAERSTNWDSALIAAFVAAMVALAGYWQTSRLNRQDRQRQLFAEAYAAARSYREFPFIVRRRIEGSTTAEITTRLSDCQVEMDKFMGLLLVESKGVGEAYANLITETRRIAGAEIAAAWESPPRSPKAAPHVREVDLAELRPTDSAYLAVVRDHLSVVPVELIRLWRRVRS
ncbi:MAG: hypothetical protein GY925_27470 [Actinomycetia bacterium]|nr:hypothetical protein [Actinomycetes bacterium]